MKIHELINNTADFSSPILIDYIEENGDRISISKNLNRKTLLSLYGDKEIVSLGADEDYLRLTISIN